MRDLRGFPMEDPRWGGGRVCPGARSKGLGVVGGDGGGEVWVWLQREPSPEAKLVHSNGKVAGLVTTVVQVAVIHGDQVHVTEDEAVVGGVLLQRL